MPVPRQEPLVKGDEVVAFWGEVLSDLPVIGGDVVGLSRKWSWEIGRLCSVDRRCMGIVWMWFVHGNEPDLGRQQLVPEQTGVVEDEERFRKVQFDVVGSLGRFHRMTVWLACR